MRDGHINCGTSIKEEINFYVTSHDKYYLDKKGEGEKENHDKHKYANERKGQKMVSTSEL